MESLADKFPQEQARCRELLQAYRDLGPAGQFGATFIEATLREADRAAAEQDVAAMVRAFKRMQEHQ